MAIRIDKISTGQRVELSNGKYEARLGWDVNEGVSPFDFDLDVQAFMLNKDKKLVSDNHLVFYNSELRVRPNNLQKVVSYEEWQREGGEWNEKMRSESRPIDPEQSVIGSLDEEEGGEEIIDIDLTKVSPLVQEIVICVSIYDNDKRKQNFGQVENAYVKIRRSNQSLDDVEYQYDLTEDFSACASIEFCRLYRKDSGWKLQALGIGHHDGLRELLNKFQ